MLFQRGGTKGSKIEEMYSDVQGSKQLKQLKIEDRHENETSLVPSSIKLITCEPDFVIFKHPIESNTPSHLVADIELPDVSLCIKDSFIEQRLNDLGTNTSAYLKHLSGDNFNEHLASINYTDVTLNLGQYHNSTTVLYNGKFGYNIEGQIQPRLNVFRYSIFLKCYGFGLKHSNLQNINYVGYEFLLNPVLQHFLTNKVIYAFLHSPSQILLTNNAQVVSFDSNQTYSGNLVIKITKVEVVKQRSIPKVPCVLRWRDWNDLVFLKHIRDIGCIPSYQESHRNFPVCSTTNETKRWYNIIHTIRNELDYLPCQQMPRIDFQLTNDMLYARKGVLGIYVGYPEQMKVITQSRAVDVNTLIGNIGGYIGLFLGTSGDLLFLIC